ncbi:alanine racemase [uncultured Kriegella sp.]|uniref:alanine racemase n=1 Tax=uncultured Kriegella sp. TaxID=1798910 RepID=UPI0030DC4C49|tara:strand:- start:87926 stop:89035 length:1110 start_codon:yes stop_codon:yes gene_type:complete
MPKAKQTILELNLNALAHNYNYLRLKLKPTTKFLAVVKAFAYGSDAVKIALKLESVGVDYFAVAYTSEGVVLREAGIKLPILVLHPLADNFDELLRHRLEPSLYSTKILSEFIALAQKKGQKDYPVHIKFNTGLNRLGFRENEVDAVLEILDRSPEVKMASIFSHLAASEDLNEKAFTLGQIETFKRIAKTIEDKLSRVVCKHTLNTSGIINYPEAQFDMVRSGIGLYGFGNDPEVDRQLKPVATLKTAISQIHSISPEESVGYNRGYISSKERVTATLPLGHADGIGKQYGNGKAYVTVNGKKAPIIGNVCMDMIMIDITGLNCQEGDEVVIFGEDPTAHEMATGVKTISYELLTGISQRVKRLCIDD